MLNQKELTKKKRVSWTTQEDKLLMQFVNKFQKDQLAWKKIAASLKKKGYNRNTKACRERYFNHLDNSYNKSELTDQEIDQLFELIKTHGNKWTSIAEEMNNRTDQDIKNNFYAHVKKIFRRLIKSTFQTSSSSNITSQIQPIIISSMFCKFDDEQDSKLLQIDGDMKELFTNLIKKHKKIGVGEILDFITINQVKTIKNYMENLNQNYLQSKIDKKQQKLINKKSKYKFVFNQIEQDRIMSKIQKKQRIFTTRNIKIDHNKQLQNFEELSIQQDTCFRPNDVVQIPSFSVSQLVSNTPFYWCQPINYQNFDFGVSNYFYSNLRENQQQGMFWQYERMDMGV